MNRRLLILGSITGIGIVLALGIICFRVPDEKSKKQEKEVRISEPERPVAAGFPQITSSYGMRIIEAESKDVFQIVNPEDDKTTAIRLRLVHALPDTLSAKDRAAIVEYLKYGPNSDIEYVIKNDLMNKLRNQKVLPPELTGALLDLYSDREQDMVVRSYALQHLRPQYELTGEVEIAKAFLAALDESENEIAGGALLALRYLATEYPDEFSAPEVSSRAAQIAADTNCYILTRISAIQVASQLGNSEVAIVARQLAEDETTPLVLRLSAVAGLGILKSPESVPLLQTLAKREDPIGNAARAALVRIN